MLTFALGVRRARASAPIVSQVVVGFSGGGGAIRSPGHSTATTMIARYHVKHKRRASPLARIIIGRALDDSCRAAFCGKLVGWLARSLARASGFAEPIAGRPELLRREQIPPMMMDSSSA